MLLMVLADDILSGRIEGSVVVSVERVQNAANNTYDVLSFLASQCGTTFALNCAEKQEKIEPETINRYRAILKAVLGRECRFPDAGLLQRPCRWDGDKADQSGRDHQHHR